MAFYGRPSLPFARPKTLQTLQTPKTPKRPLQWLLMGFQRPHPWLFMGVQACRLPGLKRSKPSKPSKTLKGHFNGFLKASSAQLFMGAHRPWLFIAVQACRLRGLKPSKPLKPLKPETLKPLKGHFNGVPLARHRQALQASGVQACRLPGLQTPSLTENSKPHTRKMVNLQWLHVTGPHSLCKRGKRTHPWLFWASNSLPFAGLEPSKPLTP